MEQVRAEQLRAERGVRGGTVKGSKTSRPRAFPIPFVCIVWTRVNRERVTESCVCVCVFVCVCVSLCVRVCVYVYTQTHTSHTYKHTADHTHTNTQHTNKTPRHTILTYVNSHILGRKPAPRNQRNNGMRCVCVGDDDDVFVLAETKKIGAKLRG